MPPAAQTTQDVSLRPQAVGLQLALSLLAAGLTGALVALLWSRLGLPDQPLALSPETMLTAAARPWGLTRLAALAGPAAVFLPSLVLGLLLVMMPGRQQPAQAALARWALKLDAVTYLACPAFFLLPLVWRELGNGLAALGLMFLGLVTVKGAFLLRVVWRGFLAPSARQGQGLGLKQQAAVFLAAWVILGLLAFWDEAAISSASDEVGYLLLTHSLATRGSFNVFPAMEGRQYEAFYWARFSPGLGQSAETAQAWLFPFLLTPAYLLAGRLGVLVFFAGLMALLACQLLAWLERVGLRPGPAAAAVGLTLASAPVLFLSQQAYPDVPAMLLMVVGLRLLLVLPARPWLHGLGLAGVAAGIAGLKFRLVPLGAGLACAGAAEILAARLGWRRALGLLACAALACAAVLWLLPVGWLPQALVEQWNLAWYQMGRAEHWWQPLTIFLTGLSLDQNFGLILTAPVFLLALAGLPAGFRHARRPTWHLLTAAGLYLALVCFTRWFQWYGGFAAPGRFVAVVLPATALWLGLGLGALNRPWLRLAISLPVAWGLIYAWLGSLIPQLRFSRPVGLNPLAAVLQGALGLDLFHLLPSTFTLSPALVPWLVASAGAAAGLAWIILAAPAPQAPRPEARPWSQAERLTLALLGGLVVAALLVIARLDPPRFLEAEQMQGKDAAAWTEYAYPDMMRGMVLLDGQSLQGRLHFPGGPAELRLVGRPETPGRLILALDGQVVAERGWPEKDRSLQLSLGPVTRGYHQVQVTWRSCDTRACGLLLDRLELAK